MRINPEILRHYWLDFSLHRTIMMPVILAMVFSILVFIDTRMDTPNETAYKLRGTAYFLFSLMVFIWGSYRASGAILNDINDRTWDYQRLSSLSAWTLSWGTVFGSTLYVWYGAAICLVVLTVSSSLIMPAAEIIHMVVTMLVAGIFCHCVITLIGMQALQTAYRNEKRRTIGYRFIALISGCIIWNIAQSMFPFGSIMFGSSLLKDVSRLDIHFYGFAFQYHTFTLMALFVFTFWAMFGVYRCMRNELKMRTTPWGWTSFLLFMILFWGGFSPRGANIDTSTLGGVFLGPINLYLFFVIAFLICIVASYAMFFSDHLSLIRYRMLFHHAKAGNFGKAWQLVPRWFISFVFAVVTGIALALVAYDNPDVGQKLPPILTVSAFLLFLIRDLAILNLFSIATDNRRALIATLFYMSVLYGLLPLLSWSVGLRINHAFYAIAASEAWVDQLPILIQVTIVIVLLALRWTGINSTIETNKHASA